MNTSKLKFVGLTLATPMFGAAPAAASASAPTTFPAHTDAAAESNLKAAILAIDPSTKLQIAGDRVEVIRLASNKHPVHRARLGRGGAANPSGGAQASSGTSVISAQGRATGANPSGGVPNANPSGGVPSINPSGGAQGRQGASPAGQGTVQNPSGGTPAPH